MLVRERDEARAELERRGGAAEGEDRHKLQLKRLEGEVWEFNHLVKRLLDQCKDILALHHIRKDISPEAEELASV